MKIKKHRSYIIASVIIALSISIYFFIRSKLAHDDQNAQFIMGTVYSFLVSISIFFVNINFVKLLQGRFPWGRKKDNIRRALLEFIITNIFAAIVVSLYALLFAWIFLDADHYSDNNMPFLFFQNIIIAIIMNTIAISIFEGAYMFRQWREAILNSEKIKREQIKSQLNALVHQLDPHFLFNSLNSLYAIVDKDPEKAKIFIKKFSDIYRYVLDVKGQLVIELKEEIKFLQEYYDLIELRYDENLKLHTKVSVKKLIMFIPPLTLQLLFENAVKHNVISTSNPLVVELYDEGQWLIMKNKIHRKHNQEQSSGTGLKNLSERYAFLDVEMPEFYIKNNYYIAKVPLIKEDE